MDNETPCLRIVMEGEIEQIIDIHPEGMSLSNYRHSPYKLDIIISYVQTAEKIDQMRQKLLQLKDKNLLLKSFELTLIPSKE
jgi:hypothetical protein